MLHTQPPHAPASETEPHTGHPAHACAWRCNRDWRDATAAYQQALDAWLDAGRTGPQPQPPDIQPWLGEPVFCRRCAAAIRGALRELPLAYDSLASVKFLTRTASADEERRGRSDVPPSPSPGADHQDEILRTTTGWEDDLRRHLHHDAATDRFGDPRATLTAAVEYLNANYQAMIERADAAPDFAQETWRLHATAVAMVKNKPVRRHLPAPCPSCDMLTLVQEEGLAGKPWYVECLERTGGCGRLYQESEYQWLTQLLTGGHVRKAAAA